MSVWDVRSGGRVVGHTDEQGAGRVFLGQIRWLLDKGTELYVVVGAARHLAVRQLVEDIKAMGVTVVFDRVAAEAVLIMQGKPEEWEELSGGN